MTKFKKIIIISVITVIIILIAIALNSSEKTTPLTENKTTSSTKSDLIQISQDVAEKPIVKDNKLFYILGKSNLVSIDLDSKQKEELYKADGEILDFYLSPESDKAILAIEKTDVTRNYHVEFANQKTTEIEQCLAEALYWIDQESLIGNCFSQESQYDPNTVNDMVLSDQFGKSKQKITSLTFEPPKKIFKNTEETYTIVTQSSGFGNNDLHKLDVKSKQLVESTQNGFIIDAKQIKPNLYLALSSESEATSSVLIIDTQNKTSKNPNLATSLDVIDASSEKIAYLVNFEDKTWLNIVSLENLDKVLNTYSLGDENANKIIYNGNNVLIFGSQGIRQLTNI